MKRLEEIKARAELVAGKPDNREPTEKEWDALTDGAIHDVPALVAVVEAVLELHKPWAVSNPSESTVNHCCDQCYEGGTGDFVSYPCPTVQAIQSALGEGEQ